MFGAAVGVLLAAAWLFHGMWQQRNMLRDAAPDLLRLQFSSEGLSSEQLVAVLKKGYRAGLWDTLALFFATKPTYATAIDVLGPPDAELGADEIARERKLEKLPKGNVNRRVIYKIGHFHPGRLEASDDFWLIEIYFRDQEFRTWSGGGFYPNDSLANFKDTRTSAKKD